MQVAAHRARRLTFAMTFVGVMMVFTHAGLLGGKRIPDYLFNGLTGLTRALLNPAD
jgi:hypothetical protein